MNLCFIISIIACSREDNTILIEPEIQESIKGIDASFIPELRELDEIVFDKDSIEVDFLDLIKASGFNTVRFRIWHSPDNQHSGLGQVKAFTEEIKSKILHMEFSGFEGYCPHQLVVCILIGLKPVIPYAPYTNRMPNCS